MSISTLQEKFKGCFTAAIVVAAVAMGASMFTSRSSGSSSQDPGGAGAANAVVSVGPVPVPAALIQAKATELQSQAMQQQAEATRVPVASLGAPDAGIQAQALVRATGQVLQGAAVQALLARAPVTDAELTAVANQIADLQIDRQRSTLVGQGKLKAGASEADLERAMKDELKGKTLAQLRADAARTLLAQAKDPENKVRLLEQLGGPILVQRLGAAAVGSDQALRDSYRTYVVRRIFLSDASGAKESASARAAKAEADLKAGKGFEQTMDAYSNEAPPTGKKLSETTETVPSALFGQRPELASLKGKAANATTPVVDVPGGKAIYQLVSTQDDLPKDFEANKAKLRAERIRTEGTAQAEKAVKALLAGTAVKWQDPGYHALGAVFDATSMGFALDPAATKRAIDLGRAAVRSESPVARRLGAQALLAATDPRASLGAKSAESGANRRIALEAAKANGIEDASLMLELAGLYGDAKDGAKAADTLVAASKDNTDYTTKGQRVFGDIAAKALGLQQKGVLTKAQLESVQAQQALWTAARADSEKQGVQAKLSDEQQRKANEAEIERQKAEGARSAPAADDARSAPAADDAARKANEAEIARQKAQGGEQAKPATTGGSLLPTTAGRGQ